ncbi:DUF536 domain-containing protein [Secundilactobacillus kimchicus]|uniref:DUF536 domain-containing protein n=1 Tax=Secundilactobacillus kimchicus TaxID=528209 RepID=UPI0024A8F02A|nr:DUF536 domain-containing protein [Secundilactobacillus kimchicus]
MSKTIKELAEELNVSKQTIQYHYQRLPAKYRQKDSVGKNIINAESERIIRSKVAKPLATKNHQNIDKEEMKGDKEDNRIIADLKLVIAEIKADRDKQITTKDRQIDNLTKLLDQSQQLQLMAEQKLAQYQALSTKASSEESPDNPTTSTKSKHKWWPFG